MLPRIIDEAEGIYLNQASSWTNAVSLAFAGSTHWALNTPAIYEIWSDVDILVYLTDAANDPPPVPLLPEQPYPGAQIMNGGILRFQWAPGDDVVTLAGTYPATGIRVVSLLGTPGNFYVNAYQRRIT